MGPIIGPITGMMFEAGYCDLFLWWRAGAPLAEFISPKGWRSGGWPETVRSKKDYLNYLREHGVVIGR